MGAEAAWVGGEAAAMRGDVGEEFGWERRGREPEGDGGDRESAEKRVGGRDAVRTPLRPGAPGSCTPSSDGLWVRTAVWDRALLLAETLLGDGSPPVCLPPPRPRPEAVPRGKSARMALWGPAVCRLSRSRTGRRAGPRGPGVRAPLGRWHLHPEGRAHRAEGGGRGVEQEGADRP